jgi:hypothetical protein
MALTLLWLFCLCSLGYLIFKSPRPESPEFSLNERLFLLLSDYTKEKKFFPRTKHNMDLLGKNLKCTKEELEVSLFILEKKGRLKLVYEGFKECYVLTPRESFSFENVALTPPIFPANSSLVKTRKKQLKDFQEVTSWSHISSEEGISSEGFTCLDVYYDPNQNFLKIVKQGVDMNGDSYVFCKFSRR